MRGYNERMKAAPVYILIALAWAASGCGQKGPLVLPDAEHPHKKAKFPALPKPPGTPSSTPSPPAGPPPNPAPPEAEPGSNPSPDAAPQS